MLNQLWVVRCQVGHCFVLDIVWLQEDRMMPKNYCIYCMDVFFKIRNAEMNKRHTAVRPTR